MILVTCVIGGYAVATGVYGIIPVLGGSVPGVWVFYLAFGLATGLGILFQLCVTRKYASRHANQTPHGSDAGAHSATCLTPQVLRGQGSRLLLGWRSQERPRVHALRAAAGSIFVRLGEARGSFAES